MFFRDFGRNVLLNLLPVNIKTTVGSTRLRVFVEILLGGRLMNKHIWRIPQTVDILLGGRLKIRISLFRKRKYTSGSKLSKAKSCFPPLESRKLKRYAFQDYRRPQVPTKLGKQQQTNISQFPRRAKNKLITIRAETEVQTKKLMSGQ